jgi:orotidine-5'-phosphate decarboxylase
MAHNPIICAIDTTDVDKAKSFINSVLPYVGCIKLGLEFFVHNGIEGVKKVIPEKTPLFLDLKFHDIPNTVAGAIHALSELNIFMTTIHISGGEAMIRAALEAARKLPSSPNVIGVTVLTSLEESDIKQLLRRGFRDNEEVNLTIKEYADNLARMALIYGLDGAVCSPHEIEVIRATCGNDFKLVVPGIRPEGSASGDQKRVMTPKEAIEKGADYLVIGRPITEAKDPAQAAKDILASL